MTLRARSTTFSGRAGVRLRPNFPPGRPSSCLPTSRTPPHSPNASATAPSAQRPATSTPPSGPLSASTRVPRSKASSSATASLPSSPRPVHLGLHAGDVIREDNNVYGGAVNIASRISGRSAPGEVLVSDTVRSLARTSAGVQFEDRGEQTLKGVGDAVRVRAVVELA
ncbi:MAG: adenylate/guanylate cyclase domain-containing protein [Chloroflexi bacterium]|nr:MAG: adenylate/guanylate cyclase domain-containing protein [Chloroflexota bacterium]